MITLMTDFGTDSPYIAAMKAAVYERLPQAVIVDLTHAIAAQDIRQGAFVWCEFTQTFPAGTVHVGIVDPGVGSKRRLIAAQCDGQFFVCPDNGLLTLILQATTPEALVEIPNPVYWRREISGTFHGRDIMAPVAAAIAGGMTPAELGTPFETSTAPILFPVSQPHFGEAEWRLEILYVDHFGNLLLNATVGMLPKTMLALLADNPEVVIGFQDRKQNAYAVFVANYSCLSPGRLALLTGSNGRLELAVVNGNAANRLSAKAGDTLIVRFIDRQHCGSLRS